MTRKAYRTRSGEQQWKPSLKATIAASEANKGWCLKCGCWVHGVEPDGRKYVHHDGCGLPKVYGAEELVLMGLVF